jgi:hypothetical protein
VKIEWTPTSDTNGAPVTQYLVEILQNDGVSFSENILYCDASPLSFAFSNLYCLIPMTVLRASPYSLSYDKVVQVRVSAKNSRGWNTVSPVNTVGANIKTEPLQMSAPTKGSSNSNS